MKAHTSLSKLARRVRAMMAREAPGAEGCWEEQTAGVERFEDLALELFALQYEQVPHYREFCDVRGMSPATVSRWEDVPCIPTSAFKELDLSALAPGARTTVFHSSGTTGQRPSRHFHSAESLELYEAAVLAGFARCGLCEDGGSPEGPAAAPESIRGGNTLSPAREAVAPPFLFLTPPPALAPHSSLVHMFETVLRRFSPHGSRFVGTVNPAGAWRLEVEAVLPLLQELAANHHPVFLMGTAFLFVHLLDDLAARDLQLELPAKSRVLETGGYKGRSRTMPKPELHDLIHRRLGIAPGRIICEYGMTELSSPAYAGVSAASSAAGRRQEPMAVPVQLEPDGVFHFPPWSRPRVVSAEDGFEVGDGEIGLLRVYDLANVWSVMAVQTEDLARRRGRGVELLGRAAQAEPRGCSLMSDAGNHPR